MKTIEFRRHSIKDGTGNYMIGPNGYAFARRVGERQLRDRGFTHFFVSTLWRTRQTLAAFAEGTGANVLMVGHSPLLEFVPYGLFGTVLPALRECDASQIIEEETGLRLGVTLGSLNVQTLL